MLVLFPVSMFLLFNFNKIQEKKNSEKRSAIEKIIKASLVSSSKYGDVIYGRASSLELGKNLGLSDLGICDGNQDILERPDESRCKKIKSKDLELTYDSAVLNGQNYELEFHWVKEGQSIFDQMIYSFFLSLIISVIFFMPLQMFLLDTILRKVKEVASFLIEDRIKSKTEVKEVSKEIPSEFRELAGFIQEKTIELQKATEDQAITAMAKNVSHDIRSPLMALNSCFERNEWKDSEDSQLMKVSLKRINDIAEDLLIKGRTSSKALTHMDLNLVLKGLIKEKKLTHKNKVNIEFRSELQEATIEVQESDLLRSLSNLINNAIEALEDREDGHVILTVFTDKGKNILSISDNGPGFPKSILDKAGREKVVSTKKTGNGMGLMSSWQMLEEMGAEVKIATSTNEGSEIQVFFDRHERSKENVDLVLIDDEKINHLSWQKSAKIKNVNLLCFYNGEDLLEYVKIQELKKETPLYLDVELKNSSGIELAYKLNQMGFSCINLSTGHGSSGLSVPDFIKSVGGKNYPG